LQRDITFKDSTGDLRHSVADLKTKTETLSASLLEQFKTGTFEFLALTLELKAEDGDTRISNATIDPQQQEMIEAKFRKNYEPPIPVIQTEETDSDYEDVKKEITKESALGVWKGIQGQVIDSINAGIDVRAPSSAFEKLGHEKTGSPALSRKETLTDAITVDRKAWEGLIVRSDTKEAFDGFWILLHEMRHLKGKKDASVGVGLYATPATRKRKQKLEDRTHTPRLTLIGEIESELNILRIGFGLPLRTNYGDNGIIYFGQVGGQEFAGGFVSGESKKERETRGAGTPLVSTRFKEDQKKKRQAEEKVVQFWGDRLKKVKKGKFYSKGLRQVDMSISVGGNAVSGTYKYVSSAGSSVSGTLEGTIMAEFTEDKLRLGVKVIFEWAQGKERGSGFWKTTVENIGDQEKSITVETHVPGAWGIRTEEGGGEWSITVPGDIASW
jgi:hypothetical protein